MQLLASKRFPPFNTLLNRLQVKGHHRCPAVTSQESRLPGVKPSYKTFKTVMLALQALQAAVTLCTRLYRVSCHCRLWHTKQPDPLFQAPEVIIRPSDRTTTVKMASCRVYLVLALCALVMAGQYLPAEARQLRGAEWDRTDTHCKTYGGLMG